jgi:hypothetical protein
MGDRARFWEKPLAELDRAQWEALCDGCGKCCLHKLEDEDTGEIHMTNVACRLLDLNDARCSNYRERHYYVPDCIRLTPAKLKTFHWLPASCAYRLRHEGKPLPDWHHLLSGSRDTVHERGYSVRGKVITEAQAGPLDQHICAAPF